MLGRFSTIFKQEITFVTPYLQSWTSYLLKRKNLHLRGANLKGVYSERKEFDPSGSKFFPFRIDPF